MDSWRGKKDACNTENQTEHQQPSMQPTAAIHASEENDDFVNEQLQLNTLIC